MSSIRLRTNFDLWVKLDVICGTCGLELTSEASEGDWLTREKRIVVKARPCARCAREAQEINGASIHREGK